MSIIRTIIVEDEREGMENLVIKISKNCPEIEIIEKCNTGNSAVKAIEKQNPDLIFLDVRLGNMTGFDVLSKLSHIHFDVIFTTAYDEYAIQAFKVNAIDYLLKPIKPKELELAVDKVRQRLDRRGSIKKIVVPVAKGFQYIPVDEIQYCLADNTYTKIYRDGSDMIMVSKTLKFISQRLPADKFLKISRSVYINLDFVDSFHRASGGQVILKGGTDLSVSKDRREEFLRRMAIR